MTRIWQEYYKGMTHLEGHTVTSSVTIFLGVGYRNCLGYRWNWKKVHWFGGRKRYRRAKPSRFLQVSELLKYPFLRKIFPEPLRQLLPVNLFIFSFLNTNAVIILFPELLEKFLIFGQKRWMKLSILRIDFQVFKHHPRNIFQVVTKSVVAL